MVEWEKLIIRGAPDRNFPGGEFRARNPDPNKATKSRQQVPRSWLHFYRKIWCASLAFKPTISRFYVAFVGVRLCRVAGPYCTAPAIVLGVLLHLLPTFLLLLLKQRYEVRPILEHQPDEVRQVV